MSSLLITIFTIILFYLIYKYINLPRILIVLLFIFFFSTFFWYVVWGHYILDPLITSYSKLVNYLIQGYIEEIIKLYTPILAIFILWKINKKNYFKYFLSLYFLSTVSFILIENYLYYIGFAEDDNATLIWYTRLFLSTSSHLIYFVIVANSIKKKISAKRIFFAFLITWFIHWLSNTLLENDIKWHLLIFLFFASIILVEIISYLKDYTKTTEKKDTLLAFIITLISFFLFSPVNFITWNYNFGTKIWHDYIQISLNREEIKKEILKYNETDITNRKNILYKYNIREENIYYKDLLSLKKKEIQKK